MDKKMKKMLDKKMKNEDMEEMASPCDHKLNVLGDISKEMKAKMVPSDKMKKVSVVAEDDDDLMEGLSKAEEMLKKMKKKK